MMMNNERAAASSVIPARTDGLCEHLMLHLWVITPEKNRSGFEFSKERTVSLFLSGRHPLKAGDLGKSLFLKIFIFRPRNSRKEPK